jgi:uncharacterized membrane protein YcaP (DUF421 family)
MTHDYLWFLSQIAARTAIVLLFLAAGLRLFGKRQLGQMNVYDLAMIMALANAVQNAMTAGKGDLSVGIVSASMLFLVGRALTVLVTRLPRLEDELVGSPTLIINDGRLNREHMRRECVSEEQVLAALRAHGLTRVEDAQLAVLEVDGTLSVVPRKDAAP